MKRWVLPAAQVVVRERTPQGVRLGPELESTDTKGFNLAFSKPAMKSHCGFFYAISQGKPDFFDKKHTTT